MRLLRAPVRSGGDQYIWFSNGCSKHLRAGGARKPFVVVFFLFLGVVFCNNIRVLPDSISVCCAAGTAAVAGRVDAVTLGGSPFIGVCMVDESLLQLWQRDRL